MVILVFVLLVAISIPTWTSATVSINNNGYRGIEIVIHEDVPENLKLLDTIKGMVSKSSPRLYDITKSRAFFEEVTVILPSTWSSKPGYKTVPEDDYFSTASVRVAPPNPKYGHTPYTFQPGGCGEFGRYIHFTPEFLLNYYQDDIPMGRVSRDTSCKNCDGLSKILLHEWLHLRYGVFNEYGLSGNPQFPMFYIGDGSKIYGNTCPEKLQGYMRRKRDGSPACYIDRKGNLIGDCIFYPRLNFGPNDTPNNASIMFMPQLYYADHICEDDDSTGGVKHNKYAPNEHNFKCEMKSVRTVMESGPDFSHGRNLQTRGLNTTATINVLHLQKDVFPGYVLVMDVSSSMTGKPLKQLQEATARAIQYKVKQSCPLGMVSFSDKSAILAQLTPMNTNTRKEMVSKIPTKASGYTAIGKGLLSAIEVLKSGNKPTDKGKIVLITDGEENRDPMIVDVVPHLQRANVIVYGISFGDKATKKIEDLSRATGGKGLSFNAAHLTQSLDSLMDEIFQSCGKAKNRPVINTNGAFKLLVGDTKSGYFHVDKSATELVSITISYDYPDRRTNDGKVPSFTVTSPNGIVYTSQSQEYNADPMLRSVMFAIINIEPGKWSYEFTNVESNNVIINMMVTSERGQVAGDPIRVNSWISEVNLTYPNVPKMYAEVSKGILPVLNANVIAHVFKPNGDTITVSLKDNGKGADAAADDGIYTEYYTHYISDGRYSIDIVVDSSNGSAGVPVTTGHSKLSGAPELPYFPEEVDAGQPQSEFSLDELEQVDEVFENSSLYQPNFSPAHETNTVKEKVEDFERFSTAGTIIVTNYQPKDMIAPDKIKDLKVIGSSAKNRTVSLEWTSPGDDMNDGRAAQFQLRYHHDVVALLDDFHNASTNYTLVNGTLEPPEPYEVHIVHLQLPSAEDLALDNSSGNLLYFAVKTLDEEQNEAIISNVVFINLVLPKPPKGLPVPFFNTSVITGIAIGAGLCLFIIVAIIGCLVFKSRKNSLVEDSKTISYTNVK